MFLYTVQENTPYQYRSFASGLPGAIDSGTLYGMLMYSYSSTSSSYQYHQLEDVLFDTMHISYSTADGTVIPHISTLKIRLNVIHVTSGYNTPFEDLVENLLPFGSILQGESQRNTFFIFWQRIGVASRSYVRSNLKMKPSAGGGISKKHIFFGNTLVLPLLMFDDADHQNDG